MQQNSTTAYSRKEEIENERLRFALVAAGIGTWDLDIIRNEVSWDERCRELFGFAPGETVAYEQVLRYMHPDDAVTVHKAVQHALDPSTEGAYEVRYRTIGDADGTLRWVLSKGKAYFNEAGVAYRFAGTAQDITESMLERGKVMASEQIARVALENTASGYFHIALSSGAMEYSPGYVRVITGEEDTTLRRDDFISHIHPDDRQLRVKAFEVAAQTGRLDYEGRVIWNDGSIHWMRAKGSYLNDASGKPAFLTGTAHDTTVEHLQREAIQEAEDLLSAAFDSASVGMAFTDLSGRFLKVNAAYASLPGYTAKELYSVNYGDLIHPEDWDRHAELFSALISGRLHYFNLTQRYMHKDGAVRWVQINVTRISGSTEKEGRVLTIARDISIELEQGNALAASQAMFKNVTNSSPTGLWLSDEEGGLTYLNKTLVEWTGMRCEDLLGAGWANAIIGEDRQRSAEVFQAAVAARAHYDVLFRIKKGDGNIVWCRAAGDPYYREDGSYAGYAGFCMDIDELVTGREALQQSEARFRSIVEQAPMAIALLSGKEMVIEVGNDKIFEVWGKDKSITGIKLMEALPEIEGQGFLELLQGVYDTGIPFYGNGVLAKLERNGRLEDAYFDFVYTPLREASGVVSGVMVLATEVTVQVIARKAREESEAKFRSLIEEAPVATCLFVGPEMKIEIANEIIIGYWGKGQSVIGKPLAEAIPELEGQPFPGILDEVFATGKTYEAKAARAELVVDGILRTGYFDFTYKPLFNSSGEVYAIINMAIDVTGQVIARRALEESELFSRSIIDNSPVAKAVFIGEDMVIERVNQNMLAILGRDAAITGKPFMEAMPELIPTPMMEQLRHVLTTGETFYQPEEKIEIIKSGAPFTGFYNYIYKALRNTADEIYGIVVTATEVTEQVLARQKVEEAEASLRSAIDLAELATWSLDAATGVLTYSDRLQFWFGFEGAETLYNTGYNPVPEKDREWLRTATAEAMNPASGGIYDTEYTVINYKTGRERIIHAQGKAQFDEGGRPVKLAGTAQDVTAQRRIQLALEQQVQERTEELAAMNEELTAINEDLAESNAQLLHSNEELAQYAYVASHDLQEPLRKIRIFTGMLEHKEGLATDNRELIGKISQSAERMSLLIRDLLDFSRLLKSETLMRPVDLAEVTTAVVRDFELAIQDKGANVLVGSMPVLQAIGLQMNQLFYNLLGNAIKFSKPSVPLVIDISVEAISMEKVMKYIHKPLPFAQYYHITVADNGIGFDTKYAEQIFEVFKRLHGREVYPGSGIGLALCRRIVANHNGHLYAESIPGEGTTFHLLLPDRQQDYQSSLPDGYQWTND